MTIAPTSTIAAIVLEHPACATILRDHRIDFCCRGERTLATACAEKGVEVSAVTADLERAIAERRERHETDPRTLSTPEVIAFIVSRHHAYLDQALCFLGPLAAKVARVHGDKEPKLLAVRDTLQELTDALEPHMREEERVLFPALTAVPLDRQRVAEELASMQAEHLEVGAMLERLRAQADDFVAPPWACGSYRTLMKELEEMEMDTLRHVHLETHVLMARFTGAPSPRERREEAVTA